MADIRKTFNFRAGVQVDDDVFIVRGEQVGIGTTIPTQSLDVRGNAKVVGILTAQNTDFSAGISTFGDVKIGTGISISASSGIITATTFSGDGSLLQNVPTSAWTQYNQLDDNGLSVVSVAKSTGNVGIATTGASSNNDLQIGSDPQDGFSKGVGIGSDGNIYASGIITATTFRGTLVGTVSTVISTQGNFSDHVSVGNTISIGGTVGLGSHVYFGDESKAIFGDSGDLEIGHSGNQNIIEDKGNGALILKTNGSAISLQRDTGATMLSAVPEQDVRLYFNGNQKFNTTDSGVDITGITTTDDLKVTGVSTFTGDVTFTGDNYDLQWDKSDDSLEFGDNTFAVFGGQGDLKIRHNATVTPNVSQISGGPLEIISDDLELKSSTGDKSYLTAIVGGGTTLFNNGNIKLETTTGGIKVTGEADVNGDLDVDGDVTVTGVSTFTGSIDANGDLDVNNNLVVQGSSTLGNSSNDKLIVTAGISTFTGNIDANGDLDVDGLTNLDHVSISGVSTFTGAIDADGDLDVNGDVTVTGVSTFTGSIDANGDLDVDGQTELDNVNVSGLSTFVGNSKFDGLLGIQTASPQTQLHVWDNAAQVARFQSNQTTSIISFVDETSTITPYIGANSNDLILGSVSGGERLRITGIGGSLGIGQTNPEQTFHVVGTSTVTSNAFFGGTVSILGNTTINANLTVDSLTVPSLNAHIIGNNAKIHSTSGISTVAAFRATGISTFSGNVTVTDGNTFQVNDGVKRFFVSASGKVGIKTTAGEDDVTIAGDTLFKTSVSVGNTARCAVDFSEVVDIQYNDGTNRSLAAYMLPPIVTTAQRNALVDGRISGNPVINGAIVFNSDAGRLEIRQGNNWYGIGTVA